MLCKLVGQDRVAEPGTTTGDDLTVRDQVSSWQELGRRTYDKQSAGTKDIGRECAFQEGLLRVTETMCVEH